MQYCLRVVVAEERVAMDTDDIPVPVTEESDLTAESLTSNVDMTCTVPNTTVCLLQHESAMPKDTLEDDGLDLAEPFSLGNIHCLNNKKTKC